MAEEQIVTFVKKLKKTNPKSWFDLAIAQFGFDKVVPLLGKING